eukprot:16442820-Heterocapsa_arctica.AAC.1
MAMLRNSKAAHLLAIRDNQPTVNPTEKEVHQLDIAHVLIEAAHYIFNLGRVKGHLCGDGGPQ